jgi:hypothetical protein
VSVVNINNPEVINIVNINLLYHASSRTLSPVIHYYTFSLQLTFLLVDYENHLLDLTLDFHCLCGQEPTLQRYLETLSISVRDSLAQAGQQPTFQGAYAGCGICSPFGLAPKLKINQTPIMALLT